MRGLCLLVQDILNGHLDAVSRSFLLASLLIPVGKANGGVRPVAVSECFYKLATMYALASVRHTFLSLFEPIQLGVGSPGGPERAVHVLRAGVELFGDESIVMKCDVRNAFNERKREQILATLYRNDSLRPIWRIANWAYGSPSDLLVLDRGSFRAIIPSEQGVKQGDCLGSFLFALSMQQSYAACCADLPEVQQVAVADDLNLVGSAASVMKAFGRYEAGLTASGLSLNYAKCGILWPHRTAVPAALKVFASSRKIPIFCDFMETLGAIIGSESPLAKRWVKDKVDAHLPFFKLLEHSAMPSQIAALILRLCAVPSMGYLSRTIPPNLLRPYALEFDSLVVRTFCRRLSLPFPLPDLAKKTLTLPIRLGGVGLRSIASTSHAAYFSAAAMAAPGVVLLVPRHRREATLANCSKARFMTAITEAHQHVRRLLPASGHRLFPETMGSFWRTYEIVGMAKKLQSALCAQIELKQLHEQLNSPSTSRIQRQRLTALSSSNAGSWLTVIPVIPELRLRDNEFAQAMRLRLGLPVAESLPRWCACNADLRDDPAHFHSCPLLKRTAVTTRHDRLVQLLANLFRTVGAVVHVEQRIFGVNRQRPDLLVITPERSVLVDVALVHLAAPSRTAVGHKRTEYDHLARLQGVSLLAFAVETFGGFGKQAVEIIDLLKAASFSSAPSIPIHRCPQRRPRC